MKIVRGGQEVINKDAIIYYAAIYSDSLSSAQVKTRFERIKRVLEPALRREEVIETWVA